VLPITSREVGAAVLWFLVAAAVLFVGYLLWLRMRSQGVRWNTGAEAQLVAVVDELIESDRYRDDLIFRQLRENRELYRGWREWAASAVRGLDVEAELGVQRTLLRLATLEQLKKMIPMRVYILLGEDWDEGMASDLRKQIFPDMADDEALGAANEGWAVSYATFVGLRIISRQVLGDGRSGDWADAYSHYAEQYWELAYKGGVERQRGEQPLSATLAKLMQETVLNDIERRVKEGGDVDLAALTSQGTWERTDGE
jgi:hypothetical protein